MRISDFLEPHLDGISRVIERHSGALSLEPYLALPEGVAHERSREPAHGRARAKGQHDDRRPDVLLLGLLGPDAERFGREDEALALLAGLGTAQRCAIVFGYPTPALPVHLLLDALAASGSQLVQLSSLEHQYLHAAALAVQVGDALTTPRDPFGRLLVPDRVDGPESPVLRRLANEFVLLDFVARNLRAQVFRLGGSSVEGSDAVRRRDELERWTEQARAQAEQARVDAEAAKTDAQLARVETEAARGEADELRREAARLSAELDRTSSSTSFLLGRTFVEAARHPSSAPRLPLDLVRLWRRRGLSADHSKIPAPPKRSRSSTVPAPVEPAGSQPGAVSVEGTDETRRFVAHVAFEMRPRLRPVVAGILTDSTANALAHDAVVNPVGPNDARLVIERTEPDIVLVETAALGPGRPWAHAGDPAATDRTARVLELIDQARALGKVAVLIRDARQPAAAGLIPLESRFDLVLDAHGAPGHNPGWSRGVQLARFNPIGARASRDPRPLFVGGLSPRAPRATLSFATEVIATVAELGLEVQADPDAPTDDAVPTTGEGGAVGAGWLPWRDAPTVYRARAVGVANPITVRDSVTVIEPRILEQLACGMGIVSGPNLALAAAFGAYVRFVHEPAEAAAAVREAISEEARSADETRALMRALFERHATPVMLTVITRQFPSVPDPRATRSVTAVVGAGSIDRARLIESLTHQAHRPAEALLTGPDQWSAAERDALEAADIATRVLESNGTETSWSAIASIATAQWLTAWPVDRPVGPCYLLDLAGGAEMSQADVVGYGPQPLGHADGVDLGAAIVRREFATTRLAGRPLGGGDAAFDALVADGRRPLSVGPEDAVG